MSHLTWTRRVVVALLALLVFGPVPSPAGAALPEWQPGADVYPSYDLGTVTQPTPVLGRDSGVSGVVGGRSIWLFGDTFFYGPNAAGQTLVTNSGGWNAPGYLPLTEPLDSTGRPPRPFVPLTTNEAAYNAQHDPVQSRYVVWPSAVISRDSLPGNQDGLIFVVRARWDGMSQIEGTQGTGIATLGQSSTTPVRRQAALYSQEDCQWLGQFLAEDGYVYAYADLSTAESVRDNCPKRAGDFPIGVARAPLASADVKGAYTYWNGSGWSTNQNATVAAMTDFHGVSVTWSDTLGKYVNVGGLGRGAHFRTADAPQGPWSAPQQLVTGRPYYSPPPPDGNLGNYAWTVHGEHQSGDDGVLLVSYLNPTSPFESRLRLVAVDLRPGAAANRSDYVDRMYRAFTGHAADPSGKAYWSGRLQTQAITPRDLASTLASSEPGRRWSVQRAYRAVLGHGADPGGESYWADQLTQSGWDYNVLVAKLATLSVFTGPHPNTPAGNDSYVTAIFPIVIGRNVDAAALSYWSGQLDAGMSRYSLVRTLQNTPEAGGYQAALAYDDILERTATAAQRAYVGSHRREATAIRIEVAGTAEAFGA